MELTKIVVYVSELAGEEKITKSDVESLFNSYDFFPYGISIESKNLEEPNSIKEVDGFEAVEHYFRYALPLKNFRILFRIKALRNFESELAELVELDGHEYEVNQLFDVGELIIYNISEKNRNELIEAISLKLGCNWLCGEEV